MSLVSITTKSAEMTERSATSITNFTKYFREMTPSSQKPYGAKEQRSKKKKKLPERKKRVEDLVGLFKEFTQDRREEEKEAINSA